jgi:hypothetical protein
MTVKSLNEAVCFVTEGRKRAYASDKKLTVQLKKLIEYAIANRDERQVDLEEKAACDLIAQAMGQVGYVVDTHVGRDVWELVSEDSQAQWLFPPEDIDDVLISLVNVANNMATNQCNIEFV